MKIKLNNLKYSGSSVNKPGYRRWFQSRHSIVNEVIEFMTTSADITISKTTYAAMRDQIEALFHLPKSLDDK